MEVGGSRFTSLFEMVQAGQTTPYSSRPTRQIERLVLLASIGRHMSIDSTDEIKLLLDANVEGLCKFVRRPGGQALVAGVL